MKIITTTLALLAILVVTVIGYAGYTAFTVTDPYVVKPASIEPAKKEAIIGYSFDKESKTLSVTTSKDVILVADPGKSFKYVEIWILERPRASNDTLLSEYKFHVSEFAQDDKIHFANTEIPTEIAKVAQRTEWN
jgi:hypothetical protein